MNKILFLDIDGVLNSVDNMIVAGYLLQIDKANKSRDEYGHLFDERCVRWLKYIIEQTKCQLVISSTWRSMGIERLKIMWKLRDLPGNIIGVTPIIVDENIFNKYPCTNNIADRGYEIQQWLDQNDKCTYCIVDDENDMLSHQTFVRTNPNTGLDYKSTLNIISALNTL